ncbi:AAA ATPase domain-containing protein [Geodermatophilus africanus]|uniref:AAA ATPase domain-containing protein n=1 Tax=Geodermatophilus africanus TaxID=1137993 RepID=A0A1H3R4H5_9ACTN|nr:effector-associated domain EAD1-containing protein [Geodermatophilus africanus]SDZ20413.1 AAA ATPase domain-containing protein [Geodermatophilus africanus]
MSAAGEEDRLGALVDEVVALLETDEDMPSPPPRPVREYGRLHEAAAVLNWFDPQTIHPAAGAGEPESIDQLLAHATRTVDRTGERRWTLSPEFRVAVLRQLRERGRVLGALTANKEVPEGSHGILHDYLEGSAPPLDEQSLAQLASSYEATEWLRAAGFEGLPGRDALQRRIDWLTLLEPFEHLAGTSFRGRVKELRRLRSYAEVLPPTDHGSSAARFVTRVTSLHEKPPLLIYGPGGVGKSTLLARFILEHAQALERDRFPFVYLDFDRPDVDASEPLTLLIEALRQLAIEYPQARERCQRIRDSWTELLISAQQPGGKSPGAATRSIVRTRSTAVRDFARLIDSLGANDRPVLFVVDTFEEVQWRSEEDVAAVWTLLEQLQPVINRLRVCIAGRGQLPGRRTDELPLEGLDEEAAVGYLLAHGISDPSVARRIARQVGGSPMSLKLAAELVREEGLTNGRLDIASREFLYIRVDDGVIQRQLYQRILGRIRNPDVQKLAHPGLVLRRLTPDLILEALAVPCRLNVRSLEQAQALFQELKRVVSLVVVASDGALEHRPDLRLLMLRLLEAEQPEQARAIRQSAVRYYERRPPEPRERAEEIYLRLALGQEPAIINPRWIEGVERHLTNVLSEFSGKRRAYLASRLKIEVDEETRRLADLEDWERLVERKAQELLLQEQPREALAELEARPDRTPASPVVSLQATALARLGQWQDSLAVLEDGIDRAITHGERRQALDLALQQAEVTLASALADDTPRLLSRLEWLTESVTTAADRLDAVAHRLALGRLAPQPAADGVELHGELRKLFDDLPDEVLGNDPALAHWVGSLFGVDDVPRLSRVLRTSGLPRTDESAVRRLASAIASSDLEHSKNIGKDPGLLTRELGIPIGDSLTASLGRFLLTASDTTVSSVLVRLLDEHTAFVTPDVLDAFANVLRSALGVERPTTRAARDNLVELVGRPRSASLPALTLARLSGALVSAFRSTTELRDFLRFRFDRSLDAISAPGSLQVAVWDVLQSAVAENWVEQLVVKAREAHPANVELAQVAEELGLSTLVPGDPALVTQAAALSGIDPTTWTRRLAAIEGQVCRVEVGDRVSGTGFLVGVDLVLTADHMLAPVHEGGMPLEDVVLRFDYKTDRSGRAVTSGIEFKVASILARSEYGNQPGRLGYNLLQVAGHPGAQPVGDPQVESSGTLRRWIEAPDPPPRIDLGDALALVQHSRGGPLNLTVGQDAVVGLSLDGTRVYYDLASMPGSSGAPCFTLDLQLVAFNIGLSIADPVNARRTFTGILMSAVLGDLRQQGHGGLLGAVFA